MQVAPPDDQILNLVAKYATKTSGAIWWPNSSLVRNKQSVAAACISDMAGVDKRNRMARRSFPFCLLLTTLSNLSHGVVDEGLVAREDGAQLELVAGA